MQYYESSFSGTTAHILKFLQNEVEFLVTPSPSKTNRMTLMKTSDFAIKYNLLAAINGDQFNYDKVLPDIGYVYGYAQSNGQIYNDNNKESTVTILKGGTVTFNAIPSEADYNAISYPKFLVGGNIIVSGLDNIFVAARTLMGRLNSGEIIWCVIDGIEGGKIGATTFQSAQFMLSLGCYVAIEFDSGGSSAMFYNGRVVSKPHDTNTNDVIERLVCNHLGIRLKTNLTHNLNIMSNGNIK